MSPPPLAEARSHYTTCAMVVIALAVIAGALALALAATGAALPFITVGGFLTTGGALVLTAAWLYSEGRALDRRALAHARARRR